ncbi:MAG: DUF4846 domain-containing protein [Flectobacillus sp.]|uniref:DUF4846 domain-containing protein n=1 Tax=Flectobacillus sp. TaxID=50419 RepID=UPI003B9A72CF
MKISYFLTIIFLANHCNDTNSSITERSNIPQNARQSPKQIHATGNTVATRFNPPVGFKRKSLSPTSFGFYLRNLPLKPIGERVKYYNGAFKKANVYEAVVDMEISNQNLQQCADAIMRLRGEYLFANKAYAEISFTLTNGFKMDYAEWINGNRLVINGNRTYWVKKALPSNNYQEFRKYMEVVFAYAGTISLSKSLKTKPLKDLQIGDVFIKSGSPGHAVIVVDLAENEKNEKMFLLAQSYMPAQETQILRNFNDDYTSPWYSDKFIGKLFTPEWTFLPSELKTW